MEDKGTLRQAVTVMQATHGGALYVTANDAFEPGLTSHVLVARVCVSPPGAGELTQAALMGLLQGEAEAAVVASASSSSSSSSASSSSGVVGAPSFIDPGDRRVTRRTFKYMAGLLSGCWIVTQEWVEECVKQR